MSAPLHIKVQDQDNVAIAVHDIAAATDAIRRLAGAEGILVDPVYTGKALSGLIGYVESGKVPQGSTVIFWHTGGATALFAEMEMVGNVAGIEE